MDKELLWSRWSSDEEEKLKALYPTLSCHDVAEVLSRPEGSTRVKAMKLGVRKNLGARPTPRIIPEDAKTIAFSLACEGTVRIGLRKNARTRQKFALSPEVALFNTDHELVKSFEGLVHCGHIYKKKTRQRKNHRLEYQWMTRRLSEIIVIMKAILPFAPSPKFRRKCELVLAYCRSRVEHGYYHQLYTNAEIKMYEECKKLNQKGASLDKY